MNYGHWTSSFEIPDNAIGFIYLITNTVNNKKYIGRKQMTMTRRKQVRKKTDPTQKKTVRETKASDWMSYTGSSVRLNADIEKYGKDKFRFEILSAHTSKSALNYAEVYELIIRGALTSKLPDGEDEYYNGVVPPVRRRPV